MRSWPSSVAQVIMRDDWFESLITAFDKIGLINAALRIALRLRDEGSPRAPHIVGAKPRK